jgi:hypothetical protein
MRINHSSPVRILTNRAPAAGVAAVTRGCEGRPLWDSYRIDSCRARHQPASRSRGHRNCTLRLYLGRLSTLPGRQGDFPHPAGFTASRENPGPGVPADMYSFVGWTGERSSTG